MTGPLVVIGAIYQALGIIIAWGIKQCFWVPHRFRYGILVAGGWGNFGDLRELPRTHWRPGLNMNTSDGCDYEHHKLISIPGQIRSRSGCRVHLCTGVLLYGVCQTGLVPRPKLKPI